MDIFYFASNHLILLIGQLHGESFEELLRELHTCRGKHIARIQNRINDLFEEVHVCKINADSGILDNPVTPLRIHS